MNGSGKKLYEIYQHKKFWGNVVYSVKPFEYISDREQAIWERTAEDFLNWYKFITILKQ